MGFECLCIVNAQGTKVCMVFPSFCVLFSCPSLSAVHFESQEWQARNILRKTLGTSQILFVENVLDLPPRFQRPRGLKRIKVGTQNCRVWESCASHNLAVWCCCCLMLFVWDFPSFQYFSLHVYQEANEHVSGTEFHDQLYYNIDVESMHSASRRKAVANYELP